MKRLALVLTPAGTVRLPTRRFALRISLVSVLATAFAATDKLTVLVLDGAGNVAGKFEAPSPVAGSQEQQSLSVNSPGGVISLLNAGAGGVNVQGFLPPDLRIEPEDSVEFSFPTAPTSVDSPLVVSYQEYRED